MSEPLLYFKHMGGSDSHLPKVRFYRSIWLNLISMCLHNKCFVILWGQLSSISSLWFMCFFENLHLLLIFKCFIALFGVAIDWYSCLCYALWCLSLRRLSCLFNPRCLSLSLFSLVFCLRTSKSLSMGGFDHYHIRIGLVGKLGVVLGD